MNETIKVDESTVEKLERLHYETESYKDLVSAYLDAHKLDPDGSAIDSPVFERYNGRYTDKFIEYNALKAELEAEHGLSGKNWTLNFKTREITVG